MGNFITDKSRPQKLEIPQMVESSSEVKKYGQQNSDVKLEGQKSAETPQSFHVAISQDS